MKKTCLLILSFIYTSIFIAQNTKVEKLKKNAVTSIDSKYDTYKAIALDIWKFAELGYKENKSSALLISTLEKEGFTIEKGVAGIPTAFVASYGSGSPVIGVLAEYDALPGLAQEVAITRKSIQGQIGGHGCGHHLFGTASIATGIEIKKLIEDKKLNGTIKVFGCPAEEGGSGKVYMTREGIFDGLDVVLHWHPSNQNRVTTVSSIANISAKFRFKGLSAHAAGAPFNGRSALDAVEAMNYMVNMLREHVPQETRIHYVITDGGKAPNVVPDYAEVYYYTRHPQREEVQKIFDRVKKCAEAAAIGTETEMTYEIIGGTHDLLLNETLNTLMQKELDKLGGVKYSEKEVQFAKDIQSSFTFSYPEISQSEKVFKLHEEESTNRGSTDVGDVSYSAPTVGIRTATWVPGTPAHSWQAVACGGTDIGIKGMMLAAKVLTSGAIELYTNPAIIKEAKKELIEKKGDYKYTPLLGNRPPALNYRD